jgi:hypothetical protein
MANEQPFIDVFLVGSTGLDYWGWFLDVFGVFVSPRPYMGFGK